MIHKIDNEEDQFVRQGKAELTAADGNNNPDLVLLFQGYMHNKQGFKLRVENVEVFHADLLDTWRQIIQKHGMTCDINADLSNSWVNITCRRVLRRRTRLFPRIPKVALPFQSIGYLLVLCAIIYILWTRNNERFQR